MHQTPEITTPHPSNAATITSAHPVDLQNMITAVSTVEPSTGRPCGLALEDGPGLRESVLAEQKLLTSKLALEMTYPQTKCDGQVET